MATLTVESASRVGAELTMNAAAIGGDEFTNDGQTVIVVANGDASPTTVTITSKYANPPVGTALSDVVVSVPAAASRFVIGPFPKDAFSPGVPASISYSSVTSLTVGVLSVR